MTPLERLAEIAALRDATTADWELLLESLGHPTKRVQRAAAETIAALARAGRAVEPVLARGLAAEAPRRRWGAAYAYALVGGMPPAGLLVVLETLGVDDGDLRWAAATILRELPDRAAVVAALHPLLGSASALQRKMALYCLRDVGVRDPALEDELRRLLEDPDAPVRIAAMAAVARLAADRDAAARAIVPRLDDAHAGVRRAAAATLGRLGAADPVVVQALTRAARDEDVPLARAATDALRRLLPTDAGPTSAR